MAQQIGFWHFTSGATLRLELYPLLGGSLANGPTGSDFAEDENTPCFYVSPLGEPLTGHFRAQVLQDGQLLYGGHVFLSGEESTTLIDGPENRSVTVSAFENTALAQLAGRRSIHVSIPTLCGQELSQPIVQGDAYLAEHGRSIEFSRSDFPDLSSDCQIQLSARPLDAVGAPFSLDGTAVVMSGQKVVRFEATSLQTRAMLPGKYEFDVEVRFPDGNAVTFVGPQAYLRVIADITGAESE